MAKMVRKQIYVGPEQEAELKRRARQTGASEAELIRQALDRHLAVVPPPPDPRGWDNERAFILDLINKGPVPGGRSWTREELHER